MTIEYELPTPPFQIRPFNAMSRGEARNHFEWFVGISGSRKDLLVSAITVAGADRSTLNFSPESLVPVWSWVSKHLKKASAKKLTPGSLALVLDTSFYLAEVFSRQYPSRLRWSLWTKKTGPYNKPVLEGFKVPFVPYDLIKVCAWTALENGFEDDLVKKKYHLWARKLDS